MAFLQFSDRQVVKTLDSSELTNLMNFTPVEDMQLKHMRVVLYIHNITPSTEQVRLHIVPSEGNSNPIFTSEWSDLSDISNLSTYWIGWLRIDFGEEFLDSDVTYTVQFESNNYTRNADVSYLALAYDWPQTINEPADSTKPPIGVEIYGLS